VVGATVKDVPTGLIKGGKQKLKGECIMRFKEWLGKYFSMLFAGYLLCTSLWFAYLDSWPACAGYFVAAIAWVVLWNSERIYTRSVDEIRQIYADSVEELRQGYQESIDRIIGGRDAT
jgi:hypothetical protein